MASSRAQIAVVAAAAASGLATSGSATGHPPVDRLLHGGLAAAVAFAAQTAPTWAVVAFSTGGAALGWRADAVGAAAGVAALAVAIILIVIENVDRHLLKAAACTLSATALLRFSGDSVGMAAVTTVALSGLLLVTGLRRSPRRWRRRVKLAAIGLVAAAGVASALGALAGLVARSAFQRSTDVTATALAAARAGDGPGAASSARAAAADLQDAQDALTTWWARPGWLVPVVGAQLRAGDEVARSAGPAVQAAAGSADVLRLDVLRPEAGRLDLDRVTAAEPRLAQLSDALHAAQRSVGRARTPWLLPPLADRLDGYDAQLASITSTSDLALLAVEALPSLLGADHPTRWFIAVGNPAESRDLGGCVCTYATVIADRGAIRLERSGGVRDIGAFEKGRSLAGLDLPERYLEYQPEIFWQNLGAYPDLPTVATAARVLWDQVAPGSPIDGVVYVDPFGLAALLKLTGPVTGPAPLGQLTSDNAAKVLLEDQYAGHTDQIGRHDAMQEATALTFDALAASQIPGPAAVGAALGPAAQGGHLLAASFNDDGQRLFDRIGASGRFPEPAGGDLASLRTSNQAENKQDAHLRRSVGYRALVNPNDRMVTATATIELHNDATADLPDYVAGNARNLPKATSLLDVAWYSGLELERAEVDGRPVTTNSSRARGWWVHSMTVTIPPGSAVTVVIHLSGRLEATNPYQLSISPQSAVHDDSYRVEVGGSPGWTSAAVPTPVPGRRTDLVVPLRAR